VLRQTAIMLRLPRPVLRLVLGNAVSAFGTGLTLPLLLIYLHRVRHIELATTGLLLAVPGIVGLVAVPVSGVLMDRIGARRVLAAAMVLLATAQVGLAFVHSAGWAVPVLMLQGIALGPTFPAYNTLIADLTSGEAQQRAFAVNFTALNAFIGLGGLVSGAVVDIAEPLTFQALFLGNALATASAAAIVLSISEPDRHARTVQNGRPVGYRQVIASPLLRRALVLTLLLALTGYAALDSGLPAYANVVSGVSAKVIALSLAANTLLIVLAQLPVLRLLRGRRRTWAVAAVGLIWCVSWVLFGFSALPSSTAARDALVLVFAALFGLGETFMAPSMAPLVNAIAPEEVRGRANALTSGMYSVAFVISPVISAAFIASGAGGFWIALLALGCLTVTAAALRLGRRLPRSQDVAADAVPELDHELAGA
jgi:MFS family permease